MLTPQASSTSACRTRWLAQTHPKSTIYHVEKRQWALGEDALLSNLIEEYAQRNWAIVASQLPHRNAKQCRERWQNQIRPNLNRAPCTTDEDATTVKAQRVVGNKWAAIARDLPGRTDNMVKKRWHATLLQSSGHSQPQPRPAPSPSPSSAQNEGAKTTQSRKRHGDEREKKAKKLKRPLCEKA